MKLILLLIVLTSSWCFVDGASSGDRKSIHGGSDNANKLFRNASLEILKWNEEDKLDERGIIMNLPSMIEFVRSTTKMMKTTVHNSATKIAAMTRNTSKSANKGRNNVKIDNTDSNNNKGDDYNTMVDCDEEDEIVTVEDFVIT